MLGKINGRGIVGTECKIYVRRKWYSNELKTNFPNHGSATSCLAKTTPMGNAKHASPTWTLSNTPRRDTGTQPHHPRPLPALGWKGGSGGSEGATECQPHAFVCKFLDHKHRFNTDKIRQIWKNTKFLSCGTTAFSTFPAAQ